MLVWEIDNKLDELRVVCESYYRSCNNDLDYSDTKQLAELVERELELIPDCLAKRKFIEEFVFNTEWTLFDEYMCR